MRVAKLLETEGTSKEILRIIEEHGKYAEVLGLSETPTGMKARLKFGDNHREQLRVQDIRILQERDWEKLIKDPYKRKML